MHTLADMETHYGITHLDHLDKQAAIPTASRLAFQGDVAIIRTNRATASKTPISATGYPVVQGEAGGNTHALFGTGFFTPTSGATTRNLSLGTLTVPEGEQVLLSHPEHGGLLIDPGTYQMRRQREQADEIRVLAD